MNEDAIKLEVAISKIVDAINDLIYRDSHQFGPRPCQTCRAITSLIGKPFGCVIPEQKQFILNLKGKTQ